MGQRVLTKEFSNSTVLVTGRISIYVLSYFQSQFLSPVSYIIGIVIKSSSSCDREKKKQRERKKERKRETHREKIIIIQTSYKFYICKLF